MDGIPRWLLRLEHHLGNAERERLCYLHLVRYITAKPSLLMANNLFLVEIAIITKVGIVLRTMETELQSPMSGESTISPCWIVDRSSERKRPPTKDQKSLNSFE